ncbi:hypothetical protein Tco_0181766, partial [Tanacetum coccineum]
WSGKVAMNAIGVSTGIINIVRIEEKAKIEREKSDKKELRELLKANAVRQKLTTVGYKLMLLGMTYYCQLKVNAARQKLTTTGER